MSDIKEIDIDFKIGDMTAEKPGHEGFISLVTGPANSNKVWAELQGKYGEDYDNRPVIVLPSEDAEGLKDFIEGFNGFDAEGGPSKEEFQQLKENVLKPSVKRIGDEVIVSRLEPADELTPFLAGFQDVLDGNVSFDFRVASNKTPSELAQAKKNVLYMMHNGARGSFNMKLSLDFLHRAFDMGTQFAPVPEPELAKEMLNFFKRSKFSFETYDVDSLPNELRDIFHHPMIEEVMNPFREEILDNIKKNVLPVLEQCKSFGTINGPIRVYFPVKDTLAVTMEFNAIDWFNIAYQMLSS